MDSSVEISHLTKEILVSTNMHSQFWNINVWDYNSGTSLQTFKNCSTIPHGLEFLKHDYMLSAVYNKPYLLYWNLKGKHQAGKINTPGIVKCVTASSCGNYLAFGIEEKVYVLQAYSGRIVSIITRHLQNVTCLKFTSNDRYLITSGEDTAIFVWDFNDILNIEKEHLNPAYSYSSHSMKINDIFVSPTSNRVLSVSLDQTCKFWDLTNANATPTQSILFQTTPTRCILDHLESSLYVGFVSGVIFSISIKSITKGVDQLIKESQNIAFIGHKQRINCLAISIDDYTLASGSDDSTIRIWDTISRQCIKIINHDGSVTNLAFKHSALFFNDESNATPTLFSRYTSEAAGADEAISTVTRKTTERLKFEDFVGERMNCNDAYLQEEYFELKCKYENMKKINEKMYNYAIDKIFHQPS